MIQQAMCADIRCFGTDRLANQDIPNISCVVSGIVVLYRWILHYPSYDEDRSLLQKPHST